MKFNVLEAGKIGTEDVLSLYLGSELLWQVMAASTNYVKKLYGYNNQSTAWGNHYGYDTAISNGIIAVTDPDTWNDNPVPGHASEIFLYDTAGTYIRSIYEPYDTGDRQNDLGRYDLAMNATHIGAGHNYGADQYFLWDINGTLIQKIERPVDFTGTSFNGGAAMNTLNLFIGGYSADVTQAVYIYDMAATYIQKIPNQDASAGFGSTIYANDTYIMIYSVTGVHIYDATTYAFIRTITSPDTQVSFGFSMVQHGSYFYISDYGYVNVGAPQYNKGRVYMFDLNGTFVKHISGDLTADQTTFGYSISADDNYLVVGDSDVGPSGSVGRGAIFLYTADGFHIKTVVPDDSVDSRDSGDYFGGSVAIENGTIIAGAWNDEEGNPDDLANTQYAGSAYIFDATTL